MARIPVTLGNRNLETGSVVRMPTSDPVGAALESAGKQLTGVAELALDRQEKKERFAAIMGWDQLNTEIAAEADNAKRNMQPGAIGLHDEIVSTYDKRASEWLSKQPPKFREEFQARIQNKRADFSRQAATVEFEEGQRFEIDGLAKSVNSAKQAILSGGDGLVDGFIRETDERINASTLSPVKKEEARRAARLDLQETGFRALAARDPKAAQAVAAGWGLGKGGIDQVVDRIIGAESGGDPTARNPNSSATGAGQFIDATWLEQVKRSRPDLAQGKSDQEILALRTNAALSREMTRAYATENSAKLGQAGIAQTPGNIYLSHFLGPGTAAKVLQADPNTPVASLVGADAIAANRSVLAGKTAGQVASWAAGKVGGGSVATGSADPRFNDLPAEKRLQLAAFADHEATRVDAENAAATTRDYNMRFNDLQTRIVDGQATVADVAVARQEGWLKDAGDIQRLTSQIATRDKGLADTQNFARALETPGFGWNPVNKDHRDWVEAGFKAQGGGMSALQTVVDRTGIVPNSAVVSLRGGLMSGNVQQVEQALQVSSNLVTGKNPGVLMSVEGGKELTTAALSYRHFVQDRGMQKAEAARRVMEQMSPEYEQKITAKIKSEDVNKIVRDNLKMGDIENHFDNSWFSDPAIGFSPGDRQLAMGHYEEAFREHYVKTGDIAQSKKGALEEMRIVWGATTVNGSRVVMRYAPERSPAYSGVDDVGALFAKQASATIKEWNGTDVERSNIILKELPGRTADKFLRGEPPVYALSYRDKNGLVQEVPKAFFADPTVMKADQTAMRSERFASEDRRAAAMEAAPTFENIVKRTGRAVASFRDDNQRAIAEAVAKRDAKNVVEAP